MGCRVRGRATPPPSRPLPSLELVSQQGCGSNMPGLLTTYLLAYRGLGIHVGAHIEEIVDTVAMGAGSRHHEGREARLCTRAGGGGGVRNTYEHEHMHSRRMYGHSLHVWCAAARRGRGRREEGRGGGGCGVTVMWGRCGWADRWMGVAAVAALASSVAFTSTPHSTRWVRAARSPLDAAA